MQAYAKYLYTYMFVAMLVCICVSRQVWYRCVVMYVAFSQPILLEL